MTQETKAKPKKKVTVIKPECFHIAPVHVNQSAKAILKKVVKFADAYKLHKHGKKEVPLVRLEPQTFNTLIDSINASLKKSDNKNIKTNHLLYKDINIIPTQVAA